MGSWCSIYPAVGGVIGQYRNQSGTGPITAWFPTEAEFEFVVHAFAGCDSKLRLPIEKRGREERDSTR